MKFKESHTFEERVKESERVRAKYPDRIPATMSEFHDQHKVKDGFPFLRFNDLPLAAVISDCVTQMIMMIVKMVELFMQFVFIVPAMLLYKICITPTRSASPLSTPGKTTLNFREKYKFEVRKLEADHLRAKYPDRIPVICEKVETSSMEDLDKKKYLVPFDLICGHFNYMIIKRLKFPAEKALFFFVNGSIPPVSATMSQLYDQHKDKDGFLYISYSEVVSSYHFLRMTYLSFFPHKRTDRY